MDLFSGSSAIPEPERIERVGARLLWYPNAFAADRADDWLQRLHQELDWHQGEARVFGRRHRIPRLQGWYGDPGTAYRYSGMTLEPSPWTETLSAIKAEVEALAGHRFNSVLANLYRDGRDSVGWHSDDEPSLGRNPVIASVSLGDTRRFQLKPKRQGDDAPCTLALSHGSLLVMAGETQHHWRHALPKTQKPVGPRINLTFRWVQTPEAPGGEPGR